MLDACPGAPASCAPGIPRLYPFLEPFVKTCQGQVAEQHAQPSVGGLLADVEPHNVASMASRLGQAHLPLQGGISWAAWAAEPLRSAWSSPGNRPVGHGDGVLGCAPTAWPQAGWPWHRTRMHDPERAARRWLAVAVATLWLLSVGGAAEETIPVSILLDVTGVCPERPRTRRATRLRLVSVCRQGWVRLLVALLRQEPWPAGRLVPEPWPVVPPLADEVCELAIVMPEAA